MADRPRRLRSRPQLRNLVRESRLDAASLLAPLFVVPGRLRREPIESLPGQARLSPDLVLQEARRLTELGVGGVVLFGVPDAKDDLGRGAADPAGPVPEALRLLRSSDLPLVLVADVCLCEYTIHGHCGILNGVEVDNDLSLPALADVGLAYAQAGADLVAPSAMMDGQVAAIRSRLDDSGLVQTGIMAYACKHASAFYAPFRDAADSTPAFGDRRSYQMDPANAREAMREMALDQAEGADVLMVKPALTSLDLLARARMRFDLPLAAYQVSGELAMLEAASERGWLERRPAALETLLAIRRAGADIIITYLAAEVASWLSEEQR
ncbi:MAG TPA: porphobilinogen synthase [Candidatus Nitrosotalea sp.]|nr:porphobilinogen synthase [Candidatus Nitrosotalea sp.]